MGAVEVCYPRCAGLDVHKKSVAACVITPEGQEAQTFGTMTQDLLRLADWLVQHRVSHVAMESTGVYWKPVWNLLEGTFKLVLANAQHIKAVPGRKTDVRDCEWIADLLRHGLIHSSFVPERPQRELRELTRYRVSLVQERSREVTRLQHTLEGGNIKLAGVATDIVGKSARQMLEAMLGGASDPQVLAELARGRLRAKLPQLQAALVGRFGPHQRFMVAQHLAHIDYLEEAITQVSSEIEERMRPFEEEVALLDTNPGIDRITAQSLLAEIGTDMTRFPTHAHLASWAKVCPGNNESAGKRKSTHTGHGNRWLRRTLVQAARSAAAPRTPTSQPSTVAWRPAVERTARPSALLIASSS